LSDKIRIIVIADYDEVEQHCKHNKINCGQASLFHSPACCNISGNCVVSQSKLTCDRQTAEKTLLTSSYMRTA